MTLEHPEMTVGRLAKMFTDNRDAGRLLLPPIQRSIVWSNEQVINYWDSLLRGYPTGMMSVHVITEEESADDKSLGRNALGQTERACKGDWLLFDGQQRMTSILLGIGKGVMRDSRRIWIDLGKRADDDSDLKFMLRISSTGQPFGYDPRNPNSKLSTSDRREKWNKWFSLKTQCSNNDLSPDRRREIMAEAFRSVTGRDLIKASCAIEMSEVHDLLSEGVACAISALRERTGMDLSSTKEFIDALRKALELPVAVQMIPASIAAHPDELIRYFQRIGQGGTRLSDDELTYCIIKQRYPRTHDCMTDIMKSPAGRLAGEVDLVLAAFRSAKSVALSPSSEPREWERIGRPSPKTVGKLEKAEAVYSEFEKLIPDA